jgi:hypothetical protein
LSESGWFPDPTGRFAQRWYDGVAWTDNVVGANGSVVADPLPQGGAPYPPPPPMPRAAPPAQQGVPQYSPAPGWQARGPQSSGRARYAPGIGLPVGLAGLVCAVLSLFVLNWAKADNSTFLDLGKAARKAGSDNYPYQAAYIYAAWAGFVFFAVVLVLVLLAGLPIPRNAAGNTYARVIGAVVAGGAAVLHTATVAEVFKGPISPQLGAWLGVAGYLVVVLGLVLGARRIRT